MIIKIIVIIIIIIIMIVVINGFNLKLIFKNNRPSWKNLLNIFN